MSARPEVTRRRGTDLTTVVSDPRAVVVTSDPLELLGKRELADLLRVNPWTVDRWRRTDPDFPAPIWISKSTPRWRRKDIEAWLATRQRGGTSPAFGEMRKHKRRRERK